MVLIGTWNPENLHRPGGPYGPPDRAAYEAKLDAIAAVVDRLGPDLLGVQEICDSGALADMVTRLGELLGSWQTALSSHPDSRGIRVSFLSRLPLTVAADTDDFPAPLRHVQEQDYGLAANRMGRGAPAA